MTAKTRGDKKYYKLAIEECKKLLKFADGAKKNTYPESGKGYAVALMTKAGNIYTGVSYLLDTETLTMHSEATALAHAAIHSEKNIAAITGPNCHIRKQLFYESSLRSGIDVVVVFEEGNKIKRIPISKMMLYPWPEKLEKLSK